MTSGQDAAQAPLAFRWGIFPLVIGELPGYWIYRWHHSKTLFEADHNYGQTSSVWGWVFGTRYLPADREPPEAIGLADLPAFPMTWWAQILSPFRWQQIKQAGDARVVDGGKAQHAIP